jgi:iron complex outermembrane receptor protein
MRFIFSFLFGLVSLFAYSQFQVSGKVVNKFNEPMENIHVHTHGKTTSTDVNGNYTIYNLKEGNHVIEFSFSGYLSFKQKYFLKSNLIINAVMIINETQIEEVAIQSKNSNVTKSQKENVISKSTIERYGSQNLGDVLKEIAGVSALKTGNSIVKPIINGLHSNRVVTLNHGIRIEDQQWGIEHAPNIDINSIQKIKVIKGSAALQYGGDAIGGVVLLEPNLIKTDTLIGKTMFSLHSNGRGGSAATSLFRAKEKGLNWNFNASMKYFGDRETKNYVLSNSGNREQNFSGGLSYQLAKHSMSMYYSLYNSQVGILKASHIGNTNDLYNAIVNFQPAVIEDFTYNLAHPKQEATHHFLKFQDHISLTDFSSLDVVYSFQWNNRKEFDVRRNSQNTNAALDLDLKTHIFKVDFQTQKGKFELKNGVNLFLQNNEANPFTGVRPLIPTFSKNEIGFYGVTNYNFSETLVFELGGRLDFSTIEASKYYLKSRWNERNYDEEFSSFIQSEVGNQYFTKPKFNYVNFSGNIGFKKTFHHDYVWYFNMNFASRNPNVSELFSDGLHHSNGQIELGDMKIQQEKSFKIASTIIKFWQKTGFEIQPYFNFINDFIFLKPIGFETTIRGAFPVWSFQQTNAVLSGIDIAFNAVILKKWSYNLGAAYVNGWDASNHKYLIDVPPLKIMNGFKWHEKNWCNFKAEVKNEWVFTQNQFPNYNFSANIIQNNQLVAIEVPISEPPKGYNLWHFYSEIQFETSKKTNLVIAFSIDNLTNEAYRDYLNRQRFFVDEMGRNFQVQIKFNY